MTQVKDRGDSYSNGLIIGFRMVQVAIGACACVDLLRWPILTNHFYRYYRRSLLLFVHCI
jgi:hypothetical protein